jgi:hypothetical protein
MRNTSEIECDACRYRLKPPKRCKRRCKLRNSQHERLKNDQIDGSWVENFNWLIEFDALRNLRPAIDMNIVLIAPEWKLKKLVSTRWCRDDKIETKFLKRLTNCVDEFKMRLNTKRCCDAWTMKTQQTKLFLREHSRAFEIREIQDNFHVINWKFNQKCMKNWKWMNWSLTTTINHENEIIKWPWKENATQNLNLDWKKLFVDVKIYRINSHVLAGFGVRKKKS